MAEDVICLLDTLGWTGERELNIVGISLGGMIAQGASVSVSPLPKKKNSHPDISCNRARIPHTEAYCFSRPCRDDTRRPHLE